MNGTPSFFGIQIATLPDNHYLFTLVPPGQGVMSNGVCYVRESDWPAVNAYVQTLVCIDKAKASRHPIDGSSCG